MSLTHIVKTQRGSNDDDDSNAGFSLFNQKKKPYQQYEQTYTAQHLHFYISEGIGPPDDYVDMIHRINIAGAADTIFIHLNTDGGQLDTGVQIINAMQNSQAKIVTILESMAYSLGSLIFLSGDELVCNDHCLLMIHNMSGGVGGKGNEMASQLEATVKWFSALAKKIYIPFLTEEEFARVIRGEDFWMQSSEIRKRLDKMMKILTSEPAPKEPKPAKKPKQPVGDVVVAEKPKRTPKVKKEVATVE